MTDDNTNADEVHSPKHRTESHDENDNRIDWTAVPDDPDADALGYEAGHWEKISVTDNEHQVIFLPSDEEAIADDAFIVLDDRDLCDLVTRR